MFSLESKHRLWHLAIYQKNKAQVQRAAPEPY